MDVKAAKELLPAEAEARYSAAQVASQPAGSHKTEVHETRDASTLPLDSR